MGLAPTGVWRSPPNTPPHLPSSQTPSLPALSFPLPPTPLGSFCEAPGGGGPGWCRGRGPRAQGGGGGGVLGRKGVEGGGGGSKRHLGPDPHLGVLDNKRNGIGRVGERTEVRGVETVLVRFPPPRFFVPPPPLAFSDPILAFLDFLFFFPSFFCAVSFLFPGFSGFRKERNSYFFGVSLAFFQTARVGGSGNCRFSEFSSDFLH